jgi:cytochrome c oxidase cbb3-type subunit III
MFNIKLSTRFKTLLLAAGTLPVSMIAAAQTTAAAANEPPQSVWSNPLALAMLAIIAVLLLVIVLMANVVLGTAEFHFKKELSTTAKAIALLIGLSLPAITNAKDAAVTPAVTNIGGLSGTTFFMLLAVIGVELIVILVMAFFVRSFLAKEKAKAAVAEGVEKKETNWQQLWDKLNSFRPITEESKIDLGHNYDGIRELNNNLPGWWLYGFYATILFSAIYLWRYHVSHSAPLSGEELKIALIKGEEQTKAYLAKAANNVDENTVTYIKDASALQAAEVIFKSTCKTCHGEKGEGNQIGPNLTDEYWIHGGSIKDIFKTIKYGYPEKGMQSWKDQYTPIQMAQLASYIKSLQGTNPPNAKAPQGDLYKETTDVPAGDSSTMPKPDTTLKNAVSKK